MPSKNQKISKPVTWNWKFLTAQFPDTQRCYTLTDRQVSALLSPLLQMAWRTRWHDPPDNFEDVLNFVYDLSSSLMSPVDCTQPVPPVPPIVQTCPELPEWITWEDGQINIQGNCNMIINIFGNCGCGCGDNNNGERTTFGGGTSSGQGASGSWTYTGSDDGGNALDYGISSCDFISYMIPKILASAAEFALYIDDNAENLDNLTDGLASLTGSIPLIGDVSGAAMQWITTVINTGSAAILAMLEDQDFEYRVMESWVKAYPDGGRLTGITRQDLLNTVPYLPNTWLGANTVILPKIIMNGIYRVLSMEKITTRFPIAAGQANNGLCEFIYAGAGINYLPAPTQETVDFPFPTVNELLADGNDWAHSLDVRIDPIPASSNFALEYGTHTPNTGYEAESVSLGGFTTRRLEMRFLLTGGLGTLTTAYVDCLYSYDPTNINQTVLKFDIDGASYPNNVDFSGVKEITGIAQNTGTMLINFITDMKSPEGAPVGGIGQVYRVALAGTGSDPFSNLPQ